MRTTAARWSPSRTEAGFVVDGVVAVAADNEVEIRNALNTAVIGEWTWWSRGRHRR